MTATRATVVRLLHATRWQTSPLEPSLCSQCFGHSSRLAPTLAHACHRRMSPPRVTAACHRRVSLPPTRVPALLAAVVGSSGILLTEPQGAAIDRFDAVVRLNRAPTRGFEAEAGRATTARLVNFPQSRAWAAQVQSTGRLPPEVTEGEHLLLMASASRWSSVAPELVSVQALNKSFRSRCVAPFFSAADQKAHRAAHRNKLTPTFGFEAVVHALYACDNVEVARLSPRPMPAHAYCTSRPIPAPHTPPHDASFHRAPPRHSASTSPRTILRSARTSN